jgi:hypothetical protein
MNHEERRMMTTLRTALTTGLLFSFALIACGPTEDERVNTDAKAVSGLDGASGADCTLTQGYWKNHASAWPTDSLTIGGVTYSEEDLLGLFNTPPKGDTSLILGHQLIAARLNVASAASAPADVAKALDAADAWMAAHKDADGTLAYGVKTGPAAAEAVALADTLASFNEGSIGPGHCGDGPSGGGGAGGGCTGTGPVDGSGSGSTSTSTSSSGSGGGSCPVGIQVCGSNVDLLCPINTTCISGCCTAVPL